MTQRSGVVTSARGEAAPRRENGGDNTSWADANLTGPKYEENPRGRFSFYKWIGKDLKQR
jgi:hypothetical protein